MSLGKFWAYVRGDWLYVSCMLAATTLVWTIFGWSENGIARAAIGLLLGVGLLVLAFVNAERRDAARRRRR